MDGVSIFEHNLLAGYDEEFLKIYEPLKQKYQDQSIFDKSISNFKKGIEEEFLTDKYEVLLLSAEFLSESSFRTIIAIKNWITSALNVSEVQIVFYVRSPAEAYKSQMIQRVKSGFEITPPADFIIDYKSIIENFQNIFGKKNITVLTYDRDNFPNSDIVYAFSEKFLSLKLHGKKVNESISLEAMLFLFQYWRDIGNMVVLDLSF
jgi:hypothetical protein